MKRTRRVPTKLRSKEINIKRKWNKGELRRKVMRLDGLSTDEKHARSCSPPERIRGGDKRVDGACSDGTTTAMQRRLLARQQNVCSSCKPGACARELAWARGGRCGLAQGPHASTAMEAGDGAWAVVGMKQEWVGLRGKKSA